MNSQEDTPFYNILFSQNVVLPEQDLFRNPHSVPAAIVISKGFIEKVLLVNHLNDIQRLSEVYSPNQIQDLGRLFISPGLIELNTCFSSPSSLQETCELQHSAVSENSGCTTAKLPCKSDGRQQGTKTALAGGVTTVIESPSLVKESLEASFYSEIIQEARQSNLYCDIGFLGYVSPRNIDQIPLIWKEGVLGFKAYMVSPAKHMGYFTRKSLQLLFEKTENKPVFFHPQLTSERFLYLSSPFRNQEMEDRQWKQSPITCFGGGFPQELNPSSSELTPINSTHSSPIKELEISETDSPDYNQLEKIFRAHSNNHSSLVQAEIRSYHHSGSTVFQPSSPKENFNTLTLVVQPCIEDTSKIAPSKIRRPPPISVIKPHIKSENRSYQLLLANSLPHWEVNGIHILVQALLTHPRSQVHIQNLSAANAIYTLQKLRKDHPYLKISCETASFYLQFSLERVSDGDTRFKVSPPIRDQANKNLLKKVLNMGILDVVSSYHRTVKPSLKCLDTGNFKRAVCGIYSIGQTLPTVLKAISSPVESAAVQIAKLMSENPAQIANLPLKGCISPGRHADLVVWDPFELSEAEQLPHISPFYGEKLPGRILRTYLRGRLVYSEGSFTPCGEVIVN